MTPMRMLKRNSLELQFWGYECGNIVAALAGVGGLSRFWSDLQLIVAGSPTNLHAAATVLRHHAELTVTFGVFAVVLLAFPLAAMARRRLGIGAANLVLIVAVAFAVTLLTYALMHRASPLTIAACAFVTGSCLLRSADAYPVLLKIGGLCLCAGGLALAWEGAANLVVVGGPILLSVLTLLSGAYVAGAGLLTYEGGVFALAAGRQRSIRPEPGLAPRLLHNSNGILARAVRPLDRPILWLGAYLIKPGVFWVGSATKAAYPFYTSMMARLPWRIAAGGVALLTGTAVGLAFAIANLLWAIGDIAIGALDWRDPDRQPA